MDQVEQIIQLLSEETTGEENIDIKNIQELKQLYNFRKEGLLHKLNII